MVARKGWGTSPLSVARREGRVREVVLAALAAECGNVTAAARRLGVDTEGVEGSAAAERLATGDIDPDDYRQRLQAYLREHSDELSEDAREAAAKGCDGIINLAGILTPGDKVARLPLSLGVVAVIRAPAARKRFCTAGSAATGLSSPPRMVSALSSAWRESASSRVASSVLRATVIVVIDSTTEAISLPDASPSGTILVSDDDEEGGGADAEHGRAPVKRGFNRKRARPRA